MFIEKACYWCQLNLYINIDYFYFIITSIDICEILVIFLIVSNTCGLVKSSCLIFMVRILFAVLSWAGKINQLVSLLQGRGNVRDGFLIELLLFFLCTCSRENKDLENLFLFK